MCGCGQRHQKGARNLSTSTIDSSTNANSGTGYREGQWERGKEAGPSLVGFLGVSTVIWEGSRQIEKMRGEMAMRE